MPNFEFCNLTVQTWFHANFIKGDFRNSTGFSLTFFHMRQNQIAMLVVWNVYERMKVIKDKKALLECFRW